MSKIFTGFAAVLFLLAPLAAQSIHVDAPNGGETLTIGTGSDIRWTATRLDQNVKIILVNDGGGIAGQIAGELAPGSSPFRWTVGEIIGGSVGAGRYKVRVATMDGGIKDVSDATFAIGDGGSPDPTPTIRVTSPRANETWLEGTAYNVTWDAGGLSGDAQVRLCYGPTSEHSFRHLQTVNVSDGNWRWVADNWLSPADERDQDPDYFYRIGISQGADGPVAYSGAFHIVRPAGHDFVISDPVFEDRGGGRKGFRVTVTDLGSDYNGRLTLQQYSMNMGLGNAIKQGETLNLRRGVPVQVDLFNVLPAYFGDDCGTSFRFDVNPDRSVPESDYGNNVMQKRFFWKSGHDGRFFSLRLGKNYTTACDHCTVIVRPEDVDIVDANRVRLRLEITLRNCGPEDIRGHNLDVVETWDGGRSSANAYRKTGIVIAGGNFSLFFIDVVLTRRASNSLEFNFDCGEGGDLDANNTFHCHLNYIGF